MGDEPSPSDGSAITTSATDLQETTWRGRLTRLGRRGFAFYAALTVFALFMVGFVGSTLLPVVTFWFGVPAQFPADFGELQFVESHRLHLIIRSAIAWTIIVPIIALFWRPRQSIGAVYQLAAFMLFLTGVQLVSRPEYITLTDVIATGVVLLLTAAVAVFHPSRDLLRDGLRPTRLSRPLLALAAVAAVPLLVYAADQLALQRVAVPLEATGEFAEHVLGFHFGDMFVASMLIILLGIVASLRPVGWWLPAATAGFFAIVIGVASVMFPAVSSSVGVIWGTLAIVWGIAFIGVSIRERSNTKKGQRGRFGLKAPP